MDVPLDSDEFSRWRRQADSAASASDRLGESGDIAWACFLCEQAAQFAAKGILHAVGADPWGHDLVELCHRAAGTLGDAWPDVEASARRLSRHYIPARYPDAHPSGTPGDHYGAEDLEQALGDRTIILDAVDEAWTTLRSGP